MENKVMICDHLELPIRNPAVSGPAVDYLSNRKEPGTTKEFTDEQMLKNWHEIGPSVVDGLKRILAAETGATSPQPQEKGETRCSRQL